MGNHWHLEQTIFVTKQELARKAIEDSNWDEAEKLQFTNVIGAVSNLLVLESFNKLDHLKAIYTKFDPDSENLESLTNYSVSEDAFLEELEKGIIDLLEKGNFERITWEMVTQWVEKSGDFWGLKLEIPHDEFERTLIYSRGEKFINRKVRRWWKPWIKEVIPTPGFSRIVVFIKMKPKERKSGEFSHQKVFLKLFKNIPKNEISMIFPGAKVRLTGIDQSLISYPLFSGIILVIYNVIMTILKVGFTALLGITTWPLALAFGGYGYKTYYNYVSKRQNYELRLTKNLYFQSLDSNAGVVMKLLEEAEEQESRECILGYYALLKYAPPQGWNEKQLDDYVELFLARNYGLEVDFEIKDCLEKLTYFGIVSSADGYYRALKPCDAITKLTELWQLNFTEKKFLNKQCSEIEHGGK
jgi:hypothetical protein